MNVADKLDRSAAKSCALKHTKNVLWRDVDRPCRRITCLLVGMIFGYFAVQLSHARAVEDRDGNLIFYLWPNSAAQQTKF